MICPICHQDVTAEQEYHFPANDVDLADAHAECAERYIAAERARIEAETVAAIVAWMHEWADNGNPAMSSDYQTALLEAAECIERGEWRQK